MVDRSIAEAQGAHDQITKTAAPCRFCGSLLSHTFVDLGKSPLCQSQLSPAQLNEMEPFYPLHVWVCGKCFLVQLQEYVSPDDIFTEYAYFSSYSDSWVRHAKNYTEMIIEKLGLNGKSWVVEIASNDGYLLQHFVARQIPVLGVEPAKNVAAAAEAKGIPTLTEFFGTQLAKRLLAERGAADLIAGNNVLAHVPDLNDFVRGLKTLLAPKGTITLEFPHLLRLMAEHQFDTIYHEHFSYFSMLTVDQVFKAHSLTVFDVDQLPTHGGSLRLYVRHSDDASRPVTTRVPDLIAVEEAAGLRKLETYAAFGERVAETKRDLLQFLIEAKRGGKQIAGYGAPGKGNTLLNYCGIRTDFLDYTVDRNPYKQGAFLPGTHIPVYSPERIEQTKPDYILILPWNLREEIMQQLSYVRSWGAQFVVPIPEVKVYP